MKRCRKTLLAGCLILFALIPYANATDLPEVEWEKVYAGGVPGRATYVRQTSDGGYIATGFIQPGGAGSGRVYLLKTLADGSPLWAKTFGEADAAGNCVQQTSDGGYIIAGWIRPDVISDPLCNAYDTYLIKTDTVGNKVWEKIFGGTNCGGYREFDWASSVQQTEDGGYIITGVTKWTLTYGEGRLIVLKTDSQGNKIWEKVFNGLDWAKGRSIQKTTDGGYIVVGHTRSSGSIVQHIYLIKIRKEDGGIIWEKIFDGPKWQEGNSVQPTSDGGYIVSGLSVESAGNADVYLLKTDANGAKIWDRSFEAGAWDVGNSVQQTFDGGFIVFGTSEPKLYLLKTDMLGNKIWDMYPGVPPTGYGTDYGYSLQQTNDGGYVLAAGGWPSNMTEPNLRPWYSFYLLKIGEENRPPVARAGSEQSVNEWTSVTLDGSWSYDPDGDTLTYSWMQIGGPIVSLNGSDTVNPTFTAPEVPAGGAILTFQLTVNDGKETSDPDIVNIVVKNVNHPPIVDAGIDQNVNEGSPVTLSGVNSYDLDGESLSYSWEQISGPSVFLSDPNAMVTSFIAPFIGPAGANLVFKLTVSDGIDQRADSVFVFVENVNHPPLANAAEDQTVNEKSLVTLNGAGSSDPDGDSLTFKWTQLSGPAIALSDSASPTPYFTAPLVNSGGVSLVFILTVNDGLGGVANDEVTISVLNSNDPPRCDLAQANPAIIWPPNHKLVPNSIVNLADPNNDQVVVSILGVTQDEPVDGLGDGDTTPDAVISGNNIMLRAERSGLGNGRVYQISFRADDSFGEGCTGVVTVCVPHDRKNGVCGNDGQIYNSTNQ